MALSAGAGNFGKVVAIDWPFVRTICVKPASVGYSGEKDTQVVPAQNEGPVRKALEAGGNECSRVEVLEGLNHLFQPCKTGEVTEYGQIEQTISPTVLKLVSGWIPQG